MEKYSNDELLEMLPTHLKETKDLTSKQKVVLGQLLIYNGLDVVKKDGYFFRSNKDLTNDCDIEEKTLITAIRKLVMLGFIERKSGSRKEGASLYKINQKTIDDYCKTPIDDNCKKDIEDYSENYSEIVKKLTDRINELEITVKNLVDRITVIEGKNYSTDTDIEIDIEKEIDKDKVIYNNTLNKDSFKNKIEEIENKKELETKEDKENTTELQLICTSTDADESDANEITTTSTNESDIADVTTTSTDLNNEDEQYQQWFQAINPFLNQLENVQTLAQYDVLKNKIKEYGNKYLNSHDYTSSTVIKKMNRMVGSALKKRKAELLPNEMELSEYIRVHDYC